MAFPHYLQLDQMDCGASCLRIIAAYFGKKIPQHILREKCHTNRRGVSLLSISHAAESIGLRTIGVRINWQQLKNEIQLPCIVYWKRRHFVVVYKIKTIHKKTYVYVSDPAEGLLKYTEHNFKKCWEVYNVETQEKLGFALLLTPSPQFYTDSTYDNQDSGISFNFLYKYFIPYKRYIVQVLLSMLIGSAISLIMPFLTQSVVDIGIGNNDLDFVVVILIAQVMLVVGQMANTLIRNWLMLHITSRTGIALISDYLRKLMRLPISYFDSKPVGDILQRIGDHSRVQDFLTSSLMGMVIAFVNFLVYSTVMAGYNVIILGIFLLGSLIYAVWVIFFLKRRKKLDYMRFQQSADNQSNLVQLVNGIQDIKLNNCEKQKRWEWERIQIKLYNIRVKGMALNQTQRVGGLFIDQTKNVLISFLAAQAVINGEMTLGMMMAVQYIIGQLNGPISQFISFIQKTQDAKISLERLNEIHRKEEEEPDDAYKVKDINITSEIEFKNVSFQYEGSHSKKVLNNINLKIKANTITAIVGASGSGKTTLIKLLMGFYQPVEGEILLDNRPLNIYSNQEWRMNIGAVMQDGYIFPDTILNNIALFDEYPNMKRIKEAVEIANVREFIDSLPLRFNTKLSADGKGISTGQKQRILIARAAYKNAPFIIFDEATNSLDANNESAIMKNMQHFFKNKTVIIVAHRLSTVKNANQIVVLDKGQIVEIGTHNQLTELKGHYYSLVKNQLELGN